MPSDKAIVSARYINKRVSNEEFKKLTSLTSMDKAMKIAQTIREQCFSEMVCEGEVAGFDFDGAKAAQIIDEALAQARLEGAKAMQEVAVKQCGNALVFSQRIAALDPQQVINESKTSA